MIRWLVFLVIGLILWPQDMYAQGRISLHVRAGYGTFSMDQLKTMQSSLAAISLQEQGISLRTFDRFPAYFNMQAQILLHMSAKYRLGAVWHATTTGGRLQLSDISGSVQSDQILVTNGVGLAFERNLYRSEAFSLLFSLKTTILFSTLDLIGTTNLPHIDFNETSTNSFKSGGFGAAPGLIAERVLFRFLFRFEGGFIITRSQTFQSGRFVLLDGAGNEVKPNWSGLRIGAGLGIYF